MNISIMCGNGNGYIMHVYQQGDTPLHWIPRSGTAAAVRLLIDRGADVNSTNKHQYSPILLAALRDNVAATSVLLAAGAVTTANVVSIF